MYDDYEDDFVPEAPPTGICKSCGEECTGRTVDFGIGPYDYGGSRGYDVRLKMVSNCCEDEIEEG